MKRILLALLFLQLGFSQTLAAQTPIEVVSSDGYTVSILLQPTGIQINTPCPNGYNYDVVFDYEIIFTGENIPARGLYTLQGDVGCGSSTLFLPLNNRGGTGQVSTRGNAYQADCDVPATIEDLFCDELILTVHGPGISSQEINASVALPVDFIAFVAHKVDKAIQLNWATASETGSDYFEVQRSNDGAEWQALGRISGVGNSDESVTYAYLDEAYAAGDLYYRLKQVDFDGGFTFSPVVSTSFNPVDGFYAYPNPATDWVTVNTQSDIELLNLTGQVVLSTADAVRSGQSQFSINVSGLPSGVYLLRNGSVVKRLVVR
ncbi:MAG: T9SS type A sorting domain-containing protein [Lewinella sp.]